jgi:cystathionine gamma-synthase
VADIAALAEIAHAAGALLAVDNTFATSYLQNPIALGADVVVHSTTKYAGGHSDVVGGALVVRDGAGVPWLDGAEDVPGDLGERVAFHQNAMGAVAGPFDAWLVQRGLKTLAVRMERHCDNAERVADFLLRHPRVGAVLYPGLPDHPGHEVAARQMRRFGGMVSFRLVGGEQDALNVCKRTEVFTLGESLGGVESLIEHPGRMTHASVTGSALEVPADLVRLSVGLEDVADLIAAPARPAPGTAQLRGLGGRGPGTARWTHGDRTGSWELTESGLTGSTPTSSREVCGPRPDGRGGCWQSARGCTCCCGCSRSSGSWSYRC